MCCTFLLESHYRLLFTSILYKTQSLVPNFITVKILQKQIFLMFYDIFKSYICQFESPKICHLWKGEAQTDRNNPNGQDGNHSANQPVQTYSAPR